MLAQDMKTHPPKYSDIQLQLILDTDFQLHKLNEQEFVIDIKNNKKIKWRVNHFLFKKRLLPYLLDVATFKQWKFFKSLNWIIAVFIIGFGIWSTDYRVLLFLVIYPFLIVSLDHWIFILNMSVVIGIKFLFNLTIPHFWFFVAVITVGYLLNKAINEFIEKKILKQALTDQVSFWKYYSGKIIWMDESTLNNEYHRLIEKYSQLRD
jgi:hypothetical protein